MVSTRRPLPRLPVPTLALAFTLASAPADARPEVAVIPEFVPMHAPLLETMRTWDDYYGARWVRHGERPPRGSGYKPFQRWKWLVERRLDEQGRLDPLARWRAFEEIRRARTGPGESLSAAGPPPEWTSLGPTNLAGRMLAHAFDPVDPRILWVGSASGGLWRTRDGGDSWQPMTDHLPSLSIAAIAIHPVDRNTMLLATGEAWGGISAEGVGVLRTTDGGMSWALSSFSYPMAEGVGCFALAWDPVLPANVYLAASNGLWTSRDAGATWSLLKAGRFVSLVLDKSDPRRIYAAQVERSAPDAQNWLWRSLDGGTNWTVLSEGLPSAIGFTSLTICDAAPNVLYAGIDMSSTPDQSCIYKSVDGGDHWQALAAAPRYVCYPPPWTGCQGWYANVIAVSPRDPDVVFAGGIHLYRSIDGGATWSVSGGTYPEMVVHVDHHGFAYDPLDPGRIFSLNDGGIHRSDDLGDTWVPRNDGLVTFQYYAFATSPFRPTLTSGGTQDNGTHLLDFVDGNSASRQWGPFADGGVTVFDHEREGILHGEEQAGTHFKSLDGGATWRYAMKGLNEAGPWITPVAMSPADSDVLFTSSRSAIFRSTDGAESWQRVHEAAMITSIAVARDDPDVIYAGSFFEAALRRSLDGGQTWAPLAVPWVFGLSDLEADPFAPGVLYATMGSYSQRPRVFRSADRGQTWMSMTGDLPVLPVNCITVAPGGALFVGTDLGVHRSNDGGVHWEPWNGTLPHVMVFDMHHVAADSTLRVATHGRGIWKVRLTSPPAVAVDEDAPAKFALEGGVPNPFHTSTRIGYRLDRAVHLRLVVLDVAGRCVRMLADGPEEAGSGSMSWDGHDDEGRPVPSGIYLLRMEAKALPHGSPASTQSRKLLKSR